MQNGRRQNMMPVPAILLAGFLCLAGAFATIAAKSPFDKLISLGILVSGAVLFMVIRTYLDVAVVAGLMMPVGTIFILLLLAKKREGQE
jgi:energy-converting hydrogenase A subunit D